jgi:hypothetical protein
MEDQAGWGATAGRLWNTPPVPMPTSGEPTLDGALVNRYGGQGLAAFLRRRGFLSPAEVLNKGQFFEGEAS